ncbi:SAV_6107 family HEPN domain-containing protein [Corynebacterium pelargi]|uniref:SAV-6107-like HEPN domain-containing protein n=1 Tax=Corynebacterium pelargi TaxID=1471400 RepID=A0A410W7V5_9CORY|nr:SAV_6107 family HEPN domain-containing protein [Corynebacterium pelargi]QAU52029.1 hypothetical protein CPELA_03750 [Corynebacterium pelargi]GGG70705.1 hypothetical protein GCM10007338_04490 [Corynebacterium pelargi]
MNTVVSATTGYQRPGKAGQLLHQSAMLQREAVAMLERGDITVALEYAYRAALRVAGAWVSQTPIARRVRKPQGVWAQLELSGEAGQAWAREFHPWSTLRARASMGLEVDVDAAKVRALMSLVEDFAQAIDGAAPMAA